MKKVLFVFLLPSLVFGGFFDWFYTSPEEVTEFNCPHRCGRWGSESLKPVEWQAVLALYEFDEMCREHNDEPSSYIPKPSGLEDPELKAFLGRIMTLKLEQDLEKSPPYKYEFDHFNGGTMFYLHRNAIEKYERQSSILWPKKMKYESQWQVVKECNDDGFEGLCFHYDCSDRIADNDGLSSEYWTTACLDSLEDCNYFVNCLTYGIEEAACFYSGNYKRCLDNIPQLVLDFEEIQKVKKKELEEFTEKYQSITWDWIKEKKEYIQSSIDQAAKTAEIAAELENFYSNEIVKLDRIRFYYIPKLEQRTVKVKEAYCGVFDYCAAHHNSPSAYLNRARYHYQEGLDMNCIADIKKLLEMTPPELFEEGMEQELLLKQARAESELALFDEAIYTLTHYINKYPEHKGALIDRAIARFEKGDFEGALADFNEKGFRLDTEISSWRNDLKFKAGLVQGILSGSTIGAIEFVPDLVNGLTGLTKGLWAVATDPKEVTNAMSSACSDAFDFIQNNGFEQAFCEVIPEFKKIQEIGSVFTDFEQGEILGQVIGRYGVPIFLMAKTAKGLKIYRDLRRANAALTLERMSVSARAEAILLAHHEEWWRKTVPIINELKAQKDLKLGSQLFKHFRAEALSENQVHQVLHYAGFKTFPRPAGIPRDWKVTFSESGGGMRYRKEVIGKDGLVKLKAEVRVMPGNPASPHKCQRSPYVKHQTKGKYLDSNGNPTKPDLPESHIPFEEYSFLKLERLDQS